jgi:hypothetical protein
VVVNVAFEDPLLHKYSYPGVPPLIIGDKVNDVFAHAFWEVGSEIEGLDFTLILTAATALQLLALVTVTETFAEEDGVKVIAEVMLPVLHVKVFDVLLNFVSSVTALNRHISKVVGKLTKGFAFIPMEVEAVPMQPVASETVTA